MIPATEEDRLKSRIYNQLKTRSKEIDSFEFAFLLKTTYEKEKYAKHFFSYSKPSSLEEELLCFAFSYLNTPPNKKRNIDINALRLIKRRNKCKGSDPISVSYFRIYNHLKKALEDLDNGICYIEDQVEFNLTECLKEFGDKTLEGELVKLAQKYKDTAESKKRKIDYQAFGLIKRCSSCKKSLGLTRSYYRFYKTWTNQD